MKGPSSPKMSCEKTLEECKDKVKEAIFSKLELHSQLGIDLIILDYDRHRFFLSGNEIKVSFEDHYTVSIHSPTVNKILNAYHRRMKLRKVFRWFGMKLF